MTRETHEVELVSAEGYPVGVASVSHAHTSPGQLHRAYSVVLYDWAGRVLLQRRSADKTRFPLRWANSCCGHPAPGEAVAAAAAKRVREELGVTSTDLAEVGHFTYRADDPTTGRVECEYDHVFVGRVAQDVRLTPDPAEVAELAWIEPAELVAAMGAAPEHYAPWLPGVLALSRSVLP